MHVVRLSDACRGGGAKSIIRALDLEAFATLGAPLQQDDEGFVWERVFLVLDLPGEVFGLRLLQPCRLLNHECRPASAAAARHGELHSTKASRRQPARLLVCSKRRLPLQRKT